MIIKETVYILVMAGSFALHSMHNDSTVPLLSTLAARTYSGYNDDPYALREKNIPEACKNLLAQAWCAHYPEKVPRYLYQCTMLSAQASRKNIIAWQEQDAILMLHTNHFTLFDTCSQRVIKEINLDQRLHNRYAQLSTDERAIAVPHKNNKTITFYDMEDDTVSTHAYNHIFHLIPIFIDTAHIILTEQSFPNIAYFCYQRNPWKEKYKIDTETFVQNTCCSVGITNDKLIINNPFLGIQLFELETGDLQEILAQSTQVRSAMLSPDKTMIAGYQKKEHSLDVLTVWNLITKRITAIDTYCQDPFFINANKIFYHSNNQVLDMKKDLIYQPYYITPKKINGNGLILKKDCSKHARRLFVSDNVTHPEFFLSNAHDPQALPELLYILDVASLVGQKNSVSGIDQCRVNKLQEELYHVSDDIDKKSITQVLHALTK